MKRWLSGLVDTALALIVVMVGLTWAWTQLRPHLLGVAVLASVLLFGYRTLRR